MLQLILLRHAKAVAGSDTGDHARSLSPRGLVDAGAAGSAILRRLRPDFALVSDARRTRETFDRVVEAMGRDIPHRFERALYGASPEDIITAAADAPPDTRRLLLIGHNPGLGELARQLARSGDGQERRDLARHFPTAAFAIIRLESDAWTHIRDGGALETFRTMDSADASD